MSEAEIPTRIELTPQEAEALKQRIKNTDLASSDIKLILGLISLSLWLQERLSRAKLTIKRLRKLFGFSTEKRKKKSKDQPGTDESEQKEASSDESNDNNDDTTAPENQAITPAAPCWGPEKNHGRYSASDYTGCSTVAVPFEDEQLKQGVCPDCKELGFVGKLYPEDPVVIVFLQSMPMVSGQRYQLQRARCSGCGKRFSAHLPEDLAQRNKYDISCYSNLAIHHYYAGIPFKRLEMLQAAQGVPLSDATQFDMMRKLYENVLSPVYQVMERQAGEGTGFYFDDTANRILEVISGNKKASPEEKKKTVHASAMISDYDTHRIYLFASNELTAGRQINALLSQRKSEDPFFTMSDGSPSNFSKEVADNLLSRWVLTLCLSHGRRKFFDLAGECDPDSEFVLRQIGKVYGNEAYCKQAGLSAEERLAYHQAHSAGEMEALRVWFNNLLLYKQVEPNSELGKAIGYMLKRWYWLTQFLRVAGAPLDNNICEQAIKVLIRYRNNSYFYKTFYGAKIGDAVMSLLHTAVRNGVNIFDYLNALQTYCAKVKAQPEDWLPWNYEQTREQLSLSERPVIFKRS